MSSEMGRRRVDSLWFSAALVLSAIGHVQSLYECFYTNGEVKKCLECCEHDCCPDNPVMQTTHFIVGALVCAGLFITIVVFIIVRVCCRRRSEPNMIWTQVQPASTVLVARQHNDVNPSHAGYDQVPTAV